MNPIDPADIARRLEAVKTQFTRQLPERLADIRSNWQAMDRQAWNWEVFQDLHRKLHTLTGSAPTFNYIQLGQDARCAELLAKSWITQNHIPDTEECDSLDSLLTALYTHTPAADDLAALVHDNQAPVTDNTATDNTVTNNTPALNQTEAPPHATDIPLLPTKPVYVLLRNRRDAAELRTQLEQFNYLITELTQEQELFHAVHTQRPAAIILDIHFELDINGEGQRLGGAELCRRLKQQCADTVAVILISEDNDFDTRLEAVRCGCDHFLSIPPDLAHLVDILDQYVHSSQPEPYRILIVDDDIELAEHYQLILTQAGMAVQSLSEPRQILSVLAEMQPELIIMDVYMPACSGQELAALIRQQENYLSIPIVFLSSELSLEKQYIALRSGGDDFFTKPIDDHHLISSVRLRAERSRLLNAEMVQDSLTGLLKHTKIKENLNIEVQRAKRSGDNLSFAMLDIDHFKSINDGYGHLTGDKVIKSLARLLQQRLRTSDGLGRYGGEEFALVLPDCDGECAGQVLADIRKSISDLTFTHEHGQFHATISIGIADLANYKSTAELIQAADDALYEAKQGGRNRIVVAPGPAGDDSGNRSGTA